MRMVTWRRISKGRCGRGEQHPGQVFEVQVLNGGAGVTSVLVLCRECMVRLVRSEGEQRGD